MSKPLQNRITNLLKHWPSDPVRPASVSVQSYLQARLGQSQSPASQPKQQSQPQAHVPMSESSANALSSLLEDRYIRRYPLSPTLRHPASNPEHYDNVIREFAEAPNRDWMGRLGKRIKGLFRLS